MCMDSVRRVIRFFPDFGAGPLWENAHPKYSMDAEDYGLSSDLSEALRSWNERWDPSADIRSEEAQKWHREGRRLAQRVAHAVVEYADVVYEA